MSNGHIISRFASAAAAIGWFAYAVSYAGGELDFWQTPNVSILAPLAMFLAGMFSLDYAVKD